jgi:hypothetical protein
MISGQPHPMQATNHAEKPHPILIFAWKATSTIILQSSFNQVLVAQIKRKRGLNFYSPANGDVDSETDSNRQNYLKN